ncbi:MAG: hypothetical protein ABI448_03080 [Bacteroidia bacterium]
MKKAILLFCVVVFASCTKKETCTCKLGNQVVYSQTKTLSSTSDKQSFEASCATYQAQLNGSGSTGGAVCTIQ